MQTAKMICRMIKSKILVRIGTLILAFTLLGMLYLQNHSNTWLSRKNVFKAGLAGGSSANFIENEKIVEILYDNEQHPEARFEMKNSNLFLQADSAPANPKHSFVTISDLIPYYLLSKKSRISSISVLDVTSMDFNVHLRDIYGRYVNNSFDAFDYISVNTLGPLQTWSKVIRNNSSHHSFTVNISRPGTYEIHVNLLQSSFRPNLVKSDLCFLPKDPAGILHVFNVHSIIKKKSAVDQRRCDRTDDVASLSQGAFVIPKRKSFEFVDGPPIWNTFNCALRHFDAKDALKLLDNKWIAFSGDSTIMELAVTTLDLLGWNKELAAWSEKSFRTFKKHKDSWRRTFDTALKVYPNRNNNTRISMFWAANTESFGNHMGLKVFDDANYVYRWKKQHSTVINTNRPYRDKPHVLVFNSGLHDFKNHDFTFDKYEERLTRVLDIIENAADTVIWKNTNPKTHDLTCRMHGHDDYTGEAGIDYINQITYKHVSKRRGMIFFDENSILRAIPAQVNHHHCENQTSCQSVLQVLLNIISMKI